MTVTLAKTAGFCFGVARCIGFVEAETEKGSVYTLGSVIHNKAVMESLRRKGVRVIESPADAVEPGALVVIRAHGVAPAVYDVLETRGLRVADYTCPLVQKIQRLVRAEAETGRRVMILGDANHPEIIGVSGWAGGNALIVNDREALDACVFESGAQYTVVAQTTFSVALFEELSAEIRRRSPDSKIENTICRATRERQEEAEQLSRMADQMIVIGDRGSSNTQKLHEICRKNQKNSYLVESIAEIELKSFSSNDRIGITAGASTPSAIIKEALRSMSELETVTTSNESFEEMLNESFVTLHTGDIVKGTVILVANGEVSVNLGYKSDGLIQRGQFSDDPSVDPAKELKIGDEIEVFVVRVNDGEGNVLLSKKRVDAQKGMLELEGAAESGAIVTGTVTEVVKGGVLVLINGTSAFVPSSQVSNRYVEDLNTLKGQTFNFKILEFDKAKRRIVAGRKELAGQEAEEARTRVYAGLEVGQKINATVTRITDFGAFVDLGGADGLVHISQLSWNRVKKVSEFLKEGQAVTVTVVSIDREKGKVSLTMKDEESNPWFNIEEKFEIGSIVEGKVVRLVSFGAFVELEPGIDGLVHISQIADKHIEKPEDELKLGQVISVKVVDVNTASRKISLSKKAVDSVMSDDADAVAPAAEVAAEEVSDESAE